MAAPLLMIILLAFNPLLLEYWMPIAVLYLLLLMAAMIRIALAQKISDIGGGERVSLARQYQTTVDISGLCWSSLVGLMLLTRGIDQLTELALIATLALTAGGFTTLTLEMTLWRRFVFALWMPLILLTTASAMQGLEHGWILLTIELLIMLFSGIQGQRVVRDYITGLLSQTDLEQAVSTIAFQRDELLTHESRLDELMEQAYRLSYYDQLTGIGSRSHFHERLTANILTRGSGQRRFAVLYLDLDGFKDINDTFGHEAGDELLKIVARRVGSLMRKDDFAARLGSDELALMVNNVANNHDALAVMQRCLKEIRLPVTLQGRTICPRASIGIALHPADGDTALALLKAAESAMHTAKRATKQRFARYSPEMTLAAEQRLSIEQELRSALTTGQFTLHFQPQISTTNGCISGVEALVRWQHPDRGLIPPAEFITVAENTGMIDELGEWVLFSSCHQAAKWFASGMPPFSVAVNISPLQLLDPGFTDTVRAALESSGIDAELLELEITESAIQTHSEARDTMMQLSELGIRIAIDDFGTGYSSLASLKELPIDRVKIDRLFVKDMLSSERDTAFLGNIINIAHLLGCDVVAEGVEERAHIDKLCALSCDCLQGYYFSQPVAAERIPEYAREACDLALEDPGLARVAVTAE
ncbi:MAG: EAL domain-containing protein [Gammaproteobacteria bacterium]|nr:EAL domain-containing protein [Gammaproteobacteria bacterium]